VFISIILCLRFLNNFSLVFIWFKGSFLFYFLGSKLPSPLVLVHQARGAHACGGLRCAASSAMALRLAALRSYRLSQPPFILKRYVFFDRFV